jgi:predicted histidine transporter YuiF (NhaC family)
MTTAAQNAARTAAQAATAWSGQDTRLVVAALLGIAVVVLVVSWAKLNAFIALLLGSAVLGLVAGMPVADILSVAVACALLATELFKGYQVNMSAAISLSVVPLPRSICIP